MPELPEVEVLARHLEPLLRERSIRAVRVHRPKIVAPASPRRFSRALLGARFLGLSRRGKYLVFSLRSARRGEPLRLVGHLGMTGRMYLLPAGASLPKHTAVSLDLGRERFVFEDTRYFGRLTLDTSPLERLGPEPLESATAPEHFLQSLRRSSQPIKVKLLDQALVAGVGNIYASEALYRARLSPQLPGQRLAPAQLRRLWRAIRQVLAEAVAGGSTVPLNNSGRGKREGLFYFGRAPGTPGFYEERLRVYDREKRPCPRCRSAIQRITQAGRSTYFCPKCQTLKP
jgi:formamidopyrimidine-DNA glycosylase